MTQLVTNEKIILSILTISFLTNCNNSQTKSFDKNDRMELVPEPDRELREEYEKQQELNKQKCAFVEPDTSVVGIKIKSRLAYLSNSMYYGKE